MIGWSFHLWAHYHFFPEHTWNFDGDTLHKLGRVRKYYQIVLHMERQRDRHTPTSRNKSQARGAKILRPLVTTTSVIYGWKSKRTTGLRGGVSHLIASHNIMTRGELSASSSGRNAAIDLIGLLHPLGLRCGLWRMTNSTTNTQVSTCARLSRVERSTSFCLLHFTKPQCCARGVCAGIEVGMVSSHVSSLTLCNLFVAVSKEFSKLFELEGLNFVLIRSVLLWICRYVD